MSRRSDRPNILFVMTDQHRWDALGCAGNSFLQTPNLDGLAAHGLRFTHNFTVWPICTPARASIWTGVYPSTHGITENVYGVPNAFASVAKVRTTVFDMLKGAGYYTSYIGKWHLGDGSPGNVDEWHGFNSFGGHWEDGKQASQGGRYKPDLETDSGVAFIERQAEREEPFFHVQSYYPPHDPYTAPPDDAEAYRATGVPHAGYYGHITALDRNIGRLIDALERSGQSDNTVVIFTSDHGDTFGFRVGGTHKVVCFDEAIRVPLVISAPNQTTRGAINGEFTGVQDLVPTILEFAGVALPGHLEGQSLMPFVQGKTPEWRQSYYIQNRQHPQLLRGPNLLFSAWPQRALRTRRWKLILSKGGPTQLYNLENDPDELLNIFPAPRKSQHDEFRHYVSTDGVVVDMARQLLGQAQAINDPIGVDLATKTIADPHYNDNWQQGGVPLPFDAGHLL